MSMTVQYNSDNKNQKKLEAVLKIKDTWSGIDAEILPRQLSKFATKSDQKGTSLGLFKSKTS